VGLLEGPVACVQERQRRVANRRLHHQRAVSSMLRELLASLLFPLLMAWRLAALALAVACRLLELARWAASTVCVCCLL